MSYYPTALRRVQITLKTSANITRYLYSRPRFVQRLDNAIHRIHHYPVDSVVCFVNTYPLDSDLSGG